MQPDRQRYLPFDGVSIGDIPPKVDENKTSSNKTSSIDSTGVSLLGDGSVQKMDESGSESPPEPAAVCGGTPGLDDEVKQAGTESQPMLVVRVALDIVSLDKTFDYFVPEQWHEDGRADQLTIGSIVRVVFNGRHERGWITEVDVVPADNIKLQPLKRLSSIGPPAELLELASWAAWRWAGKRVSLLRSASPRKYVSAESLVAAVNASAGCSKAKRVVPSRFNSLKLIVPLAGDGLRYREVDLSAAAESEHTQLLDELFQGAHKVTTIRCAPSDRGIEIALAAAKRGQALILTPDIAFASRVANSLRSFGVAVAFRFNAWKQAFAGATVVGTQKAAWMPLPSLAAVVVCDEHAEDFQAKYALTWNARDVALERARRCGVPAVLVSPVPSLEAIAASSRHKPEERPLRTSPVPSLEAIAASAEVAAESDDHPSLFDVVSGVHVDTSRSFDAAYGIADDRNGWPPTIVLDRRNDDPVKGGLFSEGLGEFFNEQKYRGRVAVILNRTGRSRLLACKACGEIVRTIDGSEPMILEDEELVSRDGSERRPAVCALCGSTVLRNLRVGVTRACEELAAFASEPVGQLTAESESIPSQRIIIGTEAVLRRMRSAYVVIFLDFDQELLATRQRATFKALMLLMWAARLLDINVDNETTGTPESSWRQTSSVQSSDRSCDKAVRTSLSNDGGQADKCLVIQTRQPNHPVVQAAVRADPSLVNQAEHDRRLTLGLPPFGVQVRVSGPGAESFLASLSTETETSAATLGEAAAFNNSVTIRGPLKGQYLLRATRYKGLLDALARTPRPSERVRIEVDPLRI
ncbi:MAG: hypothetical protein OXI96_00665 [Acidimicrobiaceae bacterium]|nr:hypothetical protein [Acidimicrobiaceae bacterium]